MDGIGSNLVLSATHFNVDYVNTESNLIDNCISKYIENKSYLDYDITYITDLGLEKDTAKLVSGTLNMNLRLLDHHLTNLFLNEYHFAYIRTHLLNKEKEEEVTCGSELCFYEFYDFIDEKYRDNLKEFIYKIKLYDTWLWKKHEDLEALYLSRLLNLIGLNKFIEDSIELKYDYKKLLNKYKMILAIEDKKINQYFDDKNSQIYPCIINGYKVGVVFAEQYISELGNELSKRNPKFDLIALVQHNKVMYRTIKDTDHCLNLAIKYNGGGQKKCAGNYLPKDITISLINSIFNK